LTYVGTYYYQPGINYGIVLIPCRCIRKEEVEPETEVQNGEGGYLKSHLVFTNSKWTTTNSIGTNREVTIWLR